MPAPHSIEAHPQKHRIIEALLAGESTRKIAAWAKPRLSAMSVQRYKASIVKPAIERSNKRVSTLNRVKAQRVEGVTPELVQDALQSVTDAPVLALRNARVALLQSLVNKLNLVIDARAEAYSEVPGGASGLLAKDYRGSGENMQEVYSVDRVVLAEARELSKQISQELGQWVEKQDVNLIAQVSSVSVTLSQALSLEDLEALRAKLLAAAPAPARTAG